MSAGSAASSEPGANFEITASTDSYGFFSIAQGRSLSGRMRDLFTNWSLGQRFEEAAKSFTGTLEKLTMDYGLKTLEGHQREVLAERKRVLGAEHPDTQVAADNLARTLADQGKRAEAEEIEREVLAVRKRVLGAETG